jgi:hypothetical protein
LGLEVSRRWILAIIAANLLALLVLVFVYPHLMAAPGPLVSAHAELATDCFACHAPLRGVSSEKCQSCHKPSEVGLRSTKGTPLATAVQKPRFHQALIEQNCLACHTDHRGPKFASADRKSFSHGLLKADLRERCDTCHVKPSDNLHRQIPGNCAQCHSQKAWKPATFNHDKLFLLDGDHNAACATCHTNNNYSRYTCYGCHEHTADRIRAKHVKEGISDFENCVECHRSSSEENSGNRTEKGSDRRKKRD